MYEIIWKGNKNTNFSSRNGSKPFVNVVHIAEGSLSSVDSWFTDATNKVASAQFCVGKGGEIHQYVKIEDYAWANGLNIGEWDNAPAQVVRDMNCNPNYYTVSIEHEGVDGDLTDEQFHASCWLQRYIMDYVKNKWGIVMNLGSYNVIGHNQIDPKRKPCCPGDKFPWDRYYAELAIAEKMTLQDYELRLSYKQDPLNNMEYCVKVRTRVEGLYQKAQGGQWSQTAADKLVAIGKFMESQDLMNP